jgi:CRP-like cAMP-binding protein
VYDIGDYVDRVYILKSGKLSVETYIEIADQNTYPISNNEWEKREVKKKILYKVRTILPGEMFGHEELIKEEDMYDHSI